MKKAKGTAGYIQFKKQKMFLLTLLEFGVVIALFVLGIITTGNRLNLLTLVAILGCLPASKTLVELIMIVPHHSVSNEVAAEIDSNTQNLIQIYDLVFTSEKNIMPVECIVISNNTVCGYTSSEKVDIRILTEHLKQYLYANHLTEVSVKIFDNYAAFIKRAEEMNRMATNEKENAVKHVLLNISL